MRVPRVRFTLQRTMVAVALLAVLLAAATAGTRPIPVAQSVNIVSGEVYWSDGVVSKGHDVPRPVETSHILFCRLVRWSDGSTSFRLPMRLGELALLAAIVILPAAAVAGTVRLVRASRELRAIRRTVATLVEENRRLREERLAFQVEQAEARPTL